MGEGYQLTKLRELVREVLRDDDSVAIANTDINDWLNEGLLQIAWRTRTVRREESNTWATAGKLPTLPTDFIEALSLRLGLDDVEFVSDDVFWDWSDNADSPPHSLGRVFAGLMEVYPTPANGTAYKLRYVARPAKLSGDTDQPEVPEVWQMKAVKYAQAQGKVKLHEYGDADRYMSEYQDGLPPVRVNEKTMPGPLSLAFPLGPWDTSDARHI